MTTKEIIYKLNLDKNLSEPAIKWIEGNSLLCQKYSSQLLKNKLNNISKLDNIKKLAIVLYTLPFTYKAYIDKGIDENIFWDTMSDIKIWCKNDFERFNTLGLDNIHWIKKHLTLKIFRLKRLQFEFSRFMVLPHAKFKDILKCPFRLGEKCITLHIPQGEKLDNELCKQSLSMANEFFAKYYPDYKYHSYTVITWLLNPDFENVLNEDSNIVKFGKMFDLLGYVPDSDMNERRVFGYDKDRKSYNPKNALQLYTLSRIQNKKPLYSYNGYRAK